MEKIISDHFEKERYFPHVSAHLIENTDRMSKRKWHTLLPMYDASHALHYSVLTVMEAYL